MKDICFSCHSGVKPGTNRCTSCGKWNFFDSGTKDKRVLLSKVIPADENRIESGPWDPCFGGGIVRSSVTLLAGEPGAGKSTLLLQLAGTISRVNYIQDHPATHPIAYIATEENEGQIKERADRIHVVGQDHILIVNAMGGMNLESLLEETKPYFVILDSLPGFTGTNNKDEAIQIIRAFKRYAEKHDCPAIVTDHVTKDLDFAGYMALMHAVDCLVMFTGNEKETRRVLVTKKNRHGPAPTAVSFSMGESGLVNPRIEKNWPRLETDGHKRCSDKSHNRTKDYWCHDCQLPTT